MNTQQSYEGQPSQSNPLEPTAITFANLEQIGLAQRQWAIDSMQYVRRRNHLSQADKQRVYDFLEPYVLRLDTALELYSHLYDAGRFAAADRIASEIEFRLQAQARYNELAQQYEFPIYPLPEPIPAAKPYEYTEFIIRGNSLGELAYSGDTIRGKFVETPGELKPKSLVVITHRESFRQPRGHTTGLLLSVDENGLTLTYDHAEITEPRPNCYFPFRKIVHIHKVESITHFLENPEPN